MEEEIKRPNRSGCNFLTGAFEVEKGDDSYEGAPINEVPSCIYREIADVIAPVLSSLINEAVASDSYPNLFKVLRVTPIHKSGSEFCFKIY